VYRRGGLGVECAPVRHHRKLRKKRLVPWPTDAEPQAHVAAAVKYVGSPEHKTSPSAAGPPRLRHNDATPCDPAYASFEAPTTALRDAILHGFVSEFVGRFPNYVWGPLDGRLYEARLVNQEQGTYKAYPLVHLEELPVDEQGLLERFASWLT